MPGLAMDLNQAPRTRARLNNNDVATATHSVVKTENDDVDDTYMPRPQLPKPLTLMRNLTDLIEMLDAGTLNVDPEYQREVVWTADRMTGLVNSLMENFYIPPIILNKKPRRRQNGNLEEVFVCVDGKQRLSSVLAFVKGMIPCHDHKGEKWWFCEIAGSKRKRIIPESQQMAFLQKDFISFEYSNLTPEQEEDLFARVQMGVQLNLAEKMRASTGPWQELASLFVQDFPSVYSLMKDRARSKDFQLTLSCFSQIVECLHPTAANGVPVLKTSHTHLPKLISNKSAVDDGLKSHLASIWNTLKGLIEADPDTFTNGNKYLRGVQTFAPVEMVAVTVLISMHSETRNNRLLIGDIQAMRIAVRENFVDLRLNAGVWRWFWEYIDELEAIRGAIDGSAIDRDTAISVRRAEQAPTHIADVGPTVAAINAAAAARKKGRYTARPKRPATSMGEETPIVVKQEEATALTPDLRLPKKPRTGDSAPDGSYIANDPLSTTPFESRADHDFSPMRHRTLTGGPQLTAQRARQRADPAPSALPRVELVPYEVLRSVHARPKPPTPSEIRQQRVSTLNNFHSAHRSMAHPMAIEGSTSQTNIMAEPRVPIAPILSGALTALPSRSESVLPSGPPETQVVPQVPASPGSRSTQKAQSDRHQFTFKDIEGAIDLTSDTEQERQDLLSSFKTRPTSSRPFDISSESATGSMTQKDTATAKAPTVLSQKLPSRENNPYARFKKE